MRTATASVRGARAAITVVAVALVAIALTPHTAWAWTPGTHVFLTEAVLRSLALLPAGLAALLKRWDPLESTCRHASLSIL